MGRPKSSVPTYCHHKDSGQAVIYIGRKPRYLGVYGSPESKREYAKVLDEVTAGVAVATSSTIPASRLTVNELLLAFVTRDLPRRSDCEADCFRAAIKVIRPLFGETFVDEFGPIRYRTVRDAMVQGDPTAVDANGKPKPRKPWARPTVNRQAKRIRQIFRWEVSWELVPSSIVQALDTVPSLAIGETSAYEPEPRLAAPQSDVDAARAQLKSKYRDILDLQLLTGARPGEILKLTGEMIERRPDCWIAELHQHKTERKGKRRFLVFNTTVQAILQRHLSNDPTAKLFPIRRDNYTPAVRRACLRAKVTPFRPHQLRHSVAARLVDDIGLEKAQHLLGHSEAAMTLHYSRSAERQAVEAAKHLDGDRTASPSK